MTKVRDLIQDSTFLTSDGFDELKPELSIFLPTYKRGDNGLFERALKSILEQDFKNFELIIIDDASIDSTAEIIQRYMKVDPRIAVIRHKENIGLAAVSEIEAYLKSRADRVAFAFDDNVFEKDGYKKLMEDQYENPSHLISYGKTKLYSTASKYAILKTELVEHKTLLQGNCIGNGSVIIHKKVFEQVGYYDPHLALMRFWDWDLWLRASRCFDFHFVNTFITSEFGVTQNDSLGNTVPFDNFVVQRHLQIERNDLLKKDTILDREIDHTPKFVGKYYKNALSDIIEKTFKGKYSINSNNSIDDGYILVVAGYYTVSLSLTFDADRNKIFFVPINIFLSNQDIYLSGAKCVVFGRDLYDANVLSFMKKLNIAYYYFTDDNLFIIPEFQATHNLNAAHAFIDNAAGIIVSTPALASAMEEMFHKKTYLMTCIRPPYLENKSDESFKQFKNIETIKIGYCSTGKSEGLIALKEKLEALAEETGKKIELYCVDVKEHLVNIKNAFCGSKYISVVTKDIDFSYEHLLWSLNQFSPHFLLHPFSSQWRQIYPYKTYNYLLNALFLRAIPIIPVRPPYDLIQDDENVGDLIAKDNDDVIAKMKYWLQADKLDIEKKLNQINVFWEQHYPIEQNKKVIEMLYEKHNVPLFADLLSNAFSLNSSETSEVETKTIITKDNFKRLLKTTEKTFKYYVRGKPLKYRTPIKYNFKNLKKQFFKTIVYYCEKRINRR